VPVVSKALGVAPFGTCVGAGELCAEPRGVSSRLAAGWPIDLGTAGSLRGPSGCSTLGSVLCGLCSNIHLLVALPHTSGLRRCDDGAGRAADAGAHLRANPNSVRAMSFVARVRPLVRSDAGHRIAGGLIVAYLNWRFIFFANLPIGIAGLILVYLHLPDYP